MAVLSLLVVSSCTKDETEFDNNRNTKEKNKDDGKDDGKDDNNKPDTYVPTDADWAVDRTLFGLLNMDYPALAGVKKVYEEKRYVQACDSLLSYFRKRSVVNPEISLSPSTFYATETSALEQSLNLRFAVKTGNYYESYSNGVYTYWSFDDGKGGINWEFIAPEVGNEWYQRHWHAWFTLYARAYRNTKDVKYFNAWKDQYTDWMKHYPIPSDSVRYTGSDITAYGYKSWCELSMANRIENQIDLFDYFIDCPAFTFDWLTTFLKAFVEMTNYSVGHLYYTSTSNIRLAQDKSHVLAGVLFPEFKDASKWLSAGAKAIEEQFSGQFNSDGVHNELDPSYHVGAIENFRKVYSVARANARLSAFGSSFLENLHNACRFVMDFVYPNYLWECFNDMRQTTKNVCLRNLRHYSELLPDDKNLQYLGSDRSSGTAPSYRVATYPVSGYYMIRSGWSSDDLMLVLKNNDQRGKDIWHCQEDNGTFGLYNKGRIFMPDAGSYTYGGTASTDAERAAFAHAKEHNTLTLNLGAISASNSRGRFVKAESTDGRDLVVTENNSYSGLTHRRSVVLVEKKFFVIVDEAYGSASGTLNLSFHLLNQVDIDDQSSRHAYGAHTTFSDGNNMQWMTFAESESGFRGENGLSRQSSALNTYNERKYYRVNSTKITGKASRFITVVYPCSSTGGANVSANFTDSGFSESGNVSLSVTVGGTTYSISYTI